MYVSKFVVLIDHQSIKYMCDADDLRGKRARWVESMQEFDLKIHYRKVSMNQHNREMHFSNCETHFNPPETWNA